MRAVIQRVKKASVTVDNTIVAQIDTGLLVFIGITQDDTIQDREYMIHKLLHLRIFEDGDSKMNRSIQDIDGQLLLVSQFTLYGDCKKGNRPSFIAAMAPVQAAIFYEQFVKECSEAYKKTSSGIFQATMDIGLINDGPVTILIDTRKQF